MIRRKGSRFPDASHLRRLLGQWPGFQPTESQTRRLLRALEMRWREEELRRSRFQGHDMLFSASLLLFLSLGSVLVGFWPIGNAWEGLALAGMLAGVVLVLFLPALMGLEPSGGRGHE